MKQLHKKIGLIACSLMMLSLQPAYATPTTPPTAPNCAALKAEAVRLEGLASAALAELAQEKANNATLKFQFKGMVANYNSQVSLAFRITPAFSTVALYNMYNKIKINPKISLAAKTALFNVGAFSEKIDVSIKRISELDGKYKVALNNSNYAKQKLSVCKP